MPVESSRLAAWLEQGLGRAVVFLKQTDARPYRELILRACTHNQVFDRQVEDGRDLFLYDVLTATNDMGYYRRPLFAALMNMDEEHDPHQLFGLVRRMAHTGDWEARNCLYAAFDLQATHDDFRGAREFIALDGLRGFLFVTAHFLRCKQVDSIVEENSDEENSNKEEADWEWWLSELEERDGKDATQAALHRLTSDLPGLSELLQLAEAERAMWQQKQDQRKKNSRPPAAPYAKIKQLIREKGRSANHYTLMSWGRRAAEGDLQQAAQDFLSVADADSLYAYTAIFMRRAFPLDADFTLEHSPLLALARSPDAEQAWRATRALGNITHPAVRSLGLELLSDSQRADEGTGLLVNNFQEDDYTLFETVLIRLDLQRTTCHSIGLDLVKLVEAHLTLQAVPSLLLLYENGPCSSCRYRCVGLLLQLDALPDSIRTECRYDADEETRKLVVTSQ
jgi:hypothetical protein